MYRILSRAPTKVEIDEIEYNINSDFRDCLSIQMAFEDNNLTNYEKCEILLYNLYSNEDGIIPEGIWNNYEKAIELGILFLNCGEEFSKREKQEKMYSLKKDIRYINAGIAKQGINIETIPYLHFWDWSNHFMEMGESQFLHIVCLRSRYKKGKLTKEEYAECERIGWNVIILDDVEEDEDCDLLDKLNN